MYESCLAFPTDRRLLQKRQWWQKQVRKHRKYKLGDDIKLLVKRVELNWLFNVTINDISVIYVTAHRCAGGLKKKLDLRSGSHAIDISQGSLTCPS